MGIVNVTPDSFFDGGRYDQVESAVQHGVELAGEGADILDLGGESTRPGAEDLPEDVEKRRVVPVIRELRGRLAVPISVDTRKARVAEAAIGTGAVVINDVTGLRHDPDLGRVAAENGTGLVLNHIRGQPKRMQENPRYDDLLSEVYDELARSADLAISLGVREDKIAIDPGIGFGKKLRHNLYLIRHLFELRSLGFPIVLGPSRKSFLGKILGLPPEGRLEGTIAACVASVRNGVDILRVHDVRAVSRAVRVAEAIERGGQ